MRNTKPIIGITMGDPAGIGPEIILKALKHNSVYRWCFPIVIGDPLVFKRTLKLVHLDRKMKIIKHVSEAEDNSRVINILDIGVKLGDFKFGEFSSSTGEVSYRAIIKSIELALSGQIHAVVTAPVSKEAINMAGYKFSGHTEIFAEYTNTAKYAMLLVDKNLRVVHVSTHVSLRKACELVKKERVLDVIELLDKACRGFGIKNPKLAVAGLNPHAGENGLLGDEEVKEIIPAIFEARRKGIDVEGPFPPDTVFPMVISGAFDGVVAMYHDQGHIPFKISGFKWDRKTGRMKIVRGVNITIGLPIIRTSVDHGTAFDIAGKGVASEEAMLNAIKYASILAKNKIKGSTW